MADGVGTLARERAVCGRAGREEDEEVAEVVYLVRGTSRFRARRVVC